MQRGAFLLLALVTLVELLALIGGVVVVRRAGRAGASAATRSLLTATTMSPRVFGWWLIATSLLLLSLSGYLVARFHA